MFQSGSVGLDKQSLALSFFDPLQKTSRVYFAKFKEYDAAKEEPEGTQEMLIVNQQDGYASFDSGGAEEKVIQLVKTFDQPYVLQQSMLITVVLEYEKNRFILGLDEPGFIFLEKPDA